MKRPVYRDSPELGFEFRVGRFLRLAGSDFQTDGAAKLNKLPLNDFTAWKEGKSEVLAGIT